MLNNKLASTVGMNEITVSATLFNGAYSPLPADELVKVRVTQFAEFIAPENPKLVREKSRAPHFVCSSLKEAELVGKTREKAIRCGQSTINKQRSSNHVTAGNTAKLDFDGITKPELKEAMAKLTGEGIAYVLYTTFSHGSKPNIRARLIVFFDRDLEPSEYKAAVLALSKLLLGKSLDPSEAYLHQQAAIYCAHPDRAHLAKRWVRLEGKCISADYLLRLVPASTLKTYTQSSLAISKVIPVDLDKIRDAFSWLNPNNYDEWKKVGMCLKALEPSLSALESEIGIGPEPALKLWLHFSEEACDEKKTRNEQSQYNPEVMFDQFKPSMIADAAMGALMNIAKRKCLEIARAENLTTADDPTLSAKGFEAIKHLRKYHPREIQLLIETSFCKEYV